MSENHVMLMARFIYSHPEHQMRSPREWKIHFEDEFNEENKICSFSALKQYSSLVRVEKQGRNSLYGSAKLLAHTPSQNFVKAPVREANRSSGMVRRNQNKQTVNLRKQVKKLPNQEPESNLSPQLALEQISQIMTEASSAIEQIVRRTKSH